MKFIAYDLGTGGVKASLYDENLSTLAKSFIEYPTYYPQNNMHEQKPIEWWEGIIESTQLLLSKSGAAAEEISCVALSGHSCVAVPLDRELRALTESVPIWSDTRAVSEAKEFFEKVDEESWYMSTGNGFPAACYYLFKLMWFKKNCPEKYERTFKVVGSKDYINLMLTGSLYTDYSYASSSGCYDLKSRTMRSDFIKAAGIRNDIFPDIVPSHKIVGHLTAEAAKAVGLHEGVAVACGGVDNACMALGSVGAQEGAVYTSLGSSSWIPVNSRQPILDFKTKPYVFAHIEENMFTSAYSIFAGGSSFQWTKNVLCKDLGMENVYQRMDELAEQVPIGSNGIIFNPSLAGGTSQDKSTNIRGAFIGLHLGTTREDLIRAALEGIALNLRMSLELISKRVTLSDHLLFCGGGSKSKVWMQMFADIFNLKIIKSNVDQDAASLGAAAICARSMELCPDYSIIPELHHIEQCWVPNADSHAEYNKIYKIFTHVCDVVADLGDYMTNA
jgi:xylulokinase